MVVVVVVDDNDDDQNIDFKTNEDGFCKINSKEITTSLELHILNKI